MSILNEAAYSKAPIAGSVIQLDVAAGEKSYVIPTAFAGLYTRWSLHADSGTIECVVVFGGAAVTADLTADTAEASDPVVLTLDDTTGDRLRSDAGAVPWVMPTPDIATHFSVDCSGAGKLVIARS